MTTTDRRQQLLETKAILEKGPLNWSDDDIRLLAVETPISTEDLTFMRHKMRRASEFSIENLRTLDAYLDQLGDPELRRKVEVSAPVSQALSTATTFTGHFARVKEQIDRIDAELKPQRFSALRERVLSARRSRTKV